MTEQCENLESLVLRRKKLDEGKRRKHIEAMERADVLRTTIELQQKALAKKESQWRWKCAKRERQLGLDEDAVKVSKLGVENVRNRLVRKEVSMGKRYDTLAVKERAAAIVRGKLDVEKQVNVFFNLIF